MNYFNSLFEQLREFWQRSSQSARVGIVGTLAVSLATLAAVGYWSSLPSYVTLAEDLNGEETAQILAELDKKNIPHKLAGAGSIVMVDQSSLAQARTAVTSLIGPSKISEDSTSSFFAGPEERHQKTLRARARDIEMAIEKLEMVKSATVLLDIAEPTLIESMRQESKASVTLTIHPGHRFPPEKASNIQKLVSHAVAGLVPNNVQVFDSNGDLLNPSDDSYGRGQVILSTVRQVEADRKLKAEALLDRLVGLGNSIVNVSASIDMSRTKTSTLQHPETGKRIQREYTNSQNTQKYDNSSQGVAGAASNPGQGSANGQLMEKTTNEIADVEYELDTVRKESEEIPELIKRLSVSAVVDVSKLPDGQTPPSIEVIEEHIKSAVGFSEARNDTISVSLAELPEDPFVSQLVAVPDGNNEFILQVVRNSSLALGALFAFVMGFLVLRKMKPITVTEPAPQLSPERTKYLSDMGKVIQQHPEIFTNVLSAWMDDEDKPNSSEQRNAA